MAQHGEAPACIIGASRPGYEAQRFKPRDLYSNERGFDVEFNKCVAILTTLSKAKANAG